MSDTLATINVDQLSSAVNAVVQAADSTQQTTTRQIQSVQPSNQVMASNVQLQVPVQTLPNNTVTIGNNGLPIMLVKVAGNQLSNPAPPLPLAINQVQTVPVIRPSAPSNANIVGQIGNVAIALQPTKSVTLTQPAQVQTITLPTINQNTPNLQGNTSTIATDMLNLTAAQNVTFGNIVSVQQKPRQDVLLLNPTGVQVNPDTGGRNVSTSGLQVIQNPTSQTSSGNSSQSPAINLNLNINLPTSSSQQTQPTVVQTLQTTPIKSCGQPLNQPRTTYQLSGQPVFQQILQPAVIQSNSIIPSSSVVSIPVAGVISPNNIIQQQSSVAAPSRMMVQMAPVVQTLPASVASSQGVKVIQPMITTQTLRGVNSTPIIQTPHISEVTPQQGTIQVCNTQAILNTTPIVQQNSQIACSLPQPIISQSSSDTTGHLQLPDNEASKHTEQYSTSQLKPTSDPVDLSGPQGQLAQEIDSLNNWTNLHITPSSTTTTLTSSCPQGTTLQSASTIQSVLPSSHSVQLQITCDDPTVQGSLPLTSVTPHLTSILSDLTQQMTSTSDTSQGISQHQYNHLPNQDSSIHLDEHDPGHMIADPVSTATMVAGVSAEDIEGLDISIPASLSGLNVTAADFLSEEIVTGFWCIDCNKYNATTCTDHGQVVIIRDSIIESRARLTLPKNLHIKTSKIASKFEGVFATETIQVRTQFGPIQGKLASKEDKTLDVDSPLVWRIYSDGNLAHYVDTTDERVSNWMMFVKQARTHKDQNLVAHQQGNSIYFTAIKTIEIGDELYVWYCRDYALWRGVPTKPEGTFPCHLCPTQFTKISQLTNHIKYSHANISQRRWKCNMCARAFASRSKLSVHILVHMGVRPHKCEHCDKTFTDPSNLRTHRLIHSDVKKFVCSLCNTGFRQKAHLETHLVTHTGEKKLKCKYCDLMFARPNDVTQHMYKHTKEKEVSCDVCGKIFWRNSHLKKHRKLHTGERDYHCTKCTKSFVTSYHLKRHLTTCKGPRFKSSTKKTRKKDKEESLPSPTKSTKVASSKGRILKPKPTFTIEARPSRLRKKNSVPLVKRRERRKKGDSQKSNDGVSRSEVVVVDTSVTCTQTDMAVEPV